FRSDRIFTFARPILKEAEQILLDLKRRIFKPVYFLSGEEPHYIDLISDYIEENVLDAADKEFNQTVVYAKHTDLGQIISLAKQFPMMSEYNVVIVKEAQNLKELSKKTADDDDDDDGPAVKTVSDTLQQLVQY